MQSASSWPGEATILKNYQADESVAYFVGLSSYTVAISIATIHVIHS